MNSYNAKPPETIVQSVSPATTFERFVPPRLGIIHLLIWTTVTAVLWKLILASKIAKFIALHLKSNQQFERIISIGIGMLTIMLLAAGLVGMGVIVVSRIRGAKGRLQPGHWLLVTYTLNNVVTTTCSLVLVSLMHSDDGVIKNIAHPEWLSTLTIATSLFYLANVMGLCLWAAFRSKGGWQWTTALCLLATLPLGRMVITTVLVRFILPQSLMIIPKLIFLAVAGLAVLIAAIIDLNKRERRDWLHWTGVAIVGGQTLVGGGSLLLCVLIR